MLIFSLVGCVGNFFITHTSIIILLRGCYLTIKPIIFYWSLCQYDFDWSDFRILMKPFLTVFPLIFLSYVCDIVYAPFRKSIGIVAQAESIRLGIRCLAGFFNRFTHAILFGLIYYAYFRYYYTGRFRKINEWFSVFMVISALKVKDLFGFIFGNSFFLFRRFKTVHILVVSVIICIAFAAYAYFMPEHYNQYINVDDDTTTARVALNVTSLKIAADHFPFGVGHGTFASPTSRQTHSEVYYQYEIDHIYGLSFERDGGCFMCDTFWPMIIGETGFLGLCLYLLIFYYVFKDYLIGAFRDTSDKRFIFPALLFLIFLPTSFGKPVFNGPSHCYVVWGFAGFFYSLKNKKYHS